MKNRYLLFNALCALCALGLLAAQAARADDKPVMLKRAYKEKGVRQYKEETKLSLQGADIVFTQTRKETVEKIKDNGEITLKTEFADPKIVGVDADAPDFPTLHVTRDKMGKLLEYRIDPESEQLFTVKIWKLREMISSLILPDNAVKENETWETEFNNPAAKDKKFKIKTQYQGTEQVDGAAVWKFKQTSEMDTDDLGNTMKYEATFYLDTRDGSLVKVEENVKDLPTNGDLGNISITHTLKAVKPEKDAK